MVLQPGDAPVELPHRLFHPFSLELHDRAECEAVIDLVAHTATHERGTPPLPAELFFEFLEAGA